VFGKTNQNLTHREREREREKKKGNVQNLDTIN
jgi:hypothetical protein